MMVMYIDHDLHTVLHLYDKEKEWEREREREIQSFVFTNSVSNQYDFYSFIVYVTWYLEI